MVAESDRNPARLMSNRLKAPGCIAEKANSVGKRATVYKCNIGCRGYNGYIRMLRQVCYQPLDKNAAAWVGAQRKGRRENADIHGSGSNR